MFHQVRSDRFSLQKNLLIMVVTYPTWPLLIVGKVIINLCGIVVALCVMCANFYYLLLLTLAGRGRRMGAETANSIATDFINGVREDVQEMVLSWKLDVCELRRQVNGIRTQQKTEIA